MAGELHIADSIFSVGEVKNRLLPTLPAKPENIQKKRYCLSQYRFFIDKTDHVFLLLDLQILYRFFVLVDPK